MIMLRSKIAKCQVQAVILGQYMINLGLSLTLLYLDILRIFVFKEILDPLISQMGFEDREPMN